MKYIFILVLLNCTLNLKNVTFTASPTANERQMVGDSKNLEKEGWLISSMRSSATGSSIWEKEILDDDVPKDFLDETTYLSLKNISYLAFEVRQFKKKEFIGEAQNGEVKILPNLKETTNFKEFPKYKNRVEDVIKLLNESRKILYEKKLQVLETKELKEEDKIKKRASIPLIFFNQVEEGEFFEIKKDKWARKE